MYTYKATVLKVIDADTLEVEIDLGFSTFTKQRIRLSGVDTSEIYGVKKESAEYQKGSEAFGFTQGWIHSTESLVLLKTEKLKKEKYGRYLAVVEATCGPHVGTTLQTSIIEAGYDKLSKLEKAETD